MQSSSVLLNYLDQLILAGEALLEKEFKVETSSYTTEKFVPLEDMVRWRGNCAVLETKMGSALGPWKKALVDGSGNKAAVARATLGTIRSIRDAIAGGHLVAFSDLILAEAFTDLLEQAEHLKCKGYWLAAGVLCRAVLEEALRNLCTKTSCVPQKDRPTLSDYNMALYNAKSYDKLEFKLIDTLGTIGNDCAHNTGTATVERVEFLFEQLTALLPRLKK